MDKQITRHLQLKNKFLKMSKIFKILFVLLLTLSIGIGIFLSLMKLRNKNEQEPLQDTGQRVIDFFKDYDIDFPQVLSIKSRLLRKSGMAYEVIKYNIDEENFYLLLNRLEKKYPIKLYQSFSPDQKIILQKMSNIFQVAEMKFDENQDSNYEIREVTVYNCDIYCYSRIMNKIVSVYMVICYN